MKIKLGKVFKGIGKVLGGIAKSLFKGKLFGILGKLIPGLNLGGILGSVFKVLGSAQKVQNFLQVGRQVFEALRGKHRIDDRVRDLPAPAYPPVHRSSTPPPPSGAIRMDPTQIRRILDEIRRILDDLRPWLRPLPDRPSVDIGPVWIDPNQRPQVPDWLQKTLESFQNPLLAPFFPFPIEQPALAAAFIGRTLQDFSLELNRFSGTLTPPSTVIR